jgi:hypothetical protein
MKPKFHLIVNLKCDFFFNETGNLQWELLIETMLHLHNYGNSLFFRAMYKIVFKNDLLINQQFQKCRNFKS